MKCFLVFAVGGPILALTKSDSPRSPEFLNKTTSWGKFVAFDVPMDSVRTAYSAHLEHVLTDPKETDELRILDTDADQIFTNVDFSLLGTPVVFQPK